MKNIVYQCAREIAPGGGVSGVAYFLYREFQALGLESRTFTIEDLGFDRQAPKSTSLAKKKLVQLFDVVYFSIVGSIVGRHRTKDAVVISHNDGLFGQIYVNHGLHRAMLDASGRKWRMLLRNPIHLFLWVREWLRFKLGVHQHYVCFSKPEAEQLAGYFPAARGKLHIIPNGVNLSRFKVDPEARQQVRTQAGIDQSQFVLIFVGHEYERKGLYHAIEALKSLPAPCILWVVGGTQNEIERGRECARQHGVDTRVRFWGVLPTAERAMAAADALVLASTFEAWPLVGLEAMACGVPVLMTPVGGIPDFLSPGVNGFFIDRSAASIAAEATKLVSQPQVLASLREGAIETASRYSWAAVAKRYLALVEQS